LEWGALEITTLSSKGVDPTLEQYFGGIRVKLCIFLKSGDDLNPLALAE